MDNLCHTLVGAAMAHAGLKSRTRLAGAALLVSANIPDLDVLVYATSIPAVSFRRGWTHGVVGQALLPVALTLALLAVARWSPPRADEPPVRPWWLLGASYLGVFSHVFLDFLNNYGVRLLAPVDWRWFYGDAVFIADPWLWAMLGAGVWFSRRRSSSRPARAALVAAGAYVVLMLGSAVVARDAVDRQWRTAHGSSPAALMVGPVPVSPFTRAVIVDAGDHYETGSYRFWPPGLTLDQATISKSGGGPVVSAARARPAIRGFLVWSRFPYWEVEGTPQGTVVTVRDVRFGRAGVGLAASVTLP